MRSIEEESGYFVLELGESLRTRECFASSDLVLDWEHHLSYIWSLPESTHTTTDILVPIQD